MDPKRRWKIGSPLAFAEVGLCLLLLGVAVGFRSRLFNWGLAVALMACMGAASVYLLWRLVRLKPGEPPPLGQVAAMPKWLKRWALGESDDK